MPIYTYQCGRCRHQTDRRMAVGLRDTVMVCPACDEGLAKRVFAPTVNIVVPEHFRHMQADFLPRPDDTAAWENLGRDSQMHARPKAGHDFEEFARRDLAQQGVRL